MFGRERFRVGGEPPIFPTMIDDLYSTRILTLAANLPHAGRLPTPDGTGERTAKLCGSRATADVTLDDQGRVSGFAQDVKACAWARPPLGYWASTSSALRFRTSRSPVTP